MYKRSLQGIFPDHLSFSNAMLRRQDALPAGDDAVSVLERECEHLRKMILDFYLKEVSLTRKLSETTMTLEKLQGENAELLKGHDYYKSEAEKYFSLYNGLQQQNTELIKGHDYYKMEAEKYFSLYNGLQQQNTELIKGHDYYKMEAEKYFTLYDGLKYAEGFGRTNWATGLIPVWRTYYWEHYAEIEQKQKKLCAGMDIESEAIVDLLMDRNFKLLPDSSNTEKFLFDYDKLYTDFEKAGMNHPFDEAIEREKFVIADENNMEETVFQLHCGLTLLPKRITDQISGKDVIDGGAYWGDTSLVFQHYYAARSVHAFEPSEENFRMLKKTVVNNGLQEIVYPVHSGLGDKDDVKTLVSYGIASTGSIMGYNVAYYNNDKKTTQEITVTTIDQYVQKHTLNVGLIKLDVEGYEYNVIMGAIETIKEQKPLLLISIYHTPRDFFDIKPLLESLNLGYRFIVRKTTYCDLIAEVMLIGYIDGGEG